MPTYTTTYSLGKPVVGADEDAWGDTLNASLDSIDDILDGTTPVTGIDINSGTLDGVTIGGTTAGAGTFTNLTATGTTTLAGASTTADITFGDNDKAIFGAGSDLQIYHDGSNSRIADQGVGGLILQGDAGVYVKSSDNTETMAQFVKDGEVSLWYDNSSKLATTSTGVDITGTLTSDGLTSAGNILVSQPSSNSSITINRTDSASQYNLTMGQSGLNPYLTGNDAQTFNINVDPDNTQASSEFRVNVDGNFAFLASSGGDISFYEDTGTTAKFFWDASAESLGIGTTSPSYTFHTKSTSGGVGLIESTTSNSDLYLKDSGTTYNYSNGIGSVGDALRFRSGDGSERMRIDSSGNVGIGTSSPLSTLHLSTTGGGSVFLQDSDATSTFNISDISNNAGNFNVATRNSSGTFVSTDYQIVKNASGADHHRWFTQGSERMRIDSSGNLLVGHTSTYSPINNGGNGVTLSANGEIFAGSSQSSGVMLLNRENSDGNILTFRKDGTTVGSIGTDGALNIGSTNTGIKFGTSAVWATTGGSTNSNGAKDLGASTVRWKDLYLSGGVYLGGTGSANHLDDYEEGTFTPTFVGSTGGTVTLGSAFDKYAYTKIGRMVTITGRVDVSGTPSLSGNLLLQGLPFTSGNLTDQAGYTVQYGFITIGASNTGNPIVIEIQENTTEAALRLEDWTTAAGVLTNNSRIQMSITYFTA